MKLGALLFMCGNNRIASGIDRDDTAVDMHIPVFAFSDDLTAVRRDLLLAPAYHIIYI